MKMRGGPDGLHYFDRRSGLNILFDEIDVPQEQWAKAPRHVSIALTNTCDLKCPHCFAPKYPAQLEFLELTSWLEELDKNGCIGVGFGGGEPTLYKDFSKLCKHAAEKTKLSVTFTTNGHHIDSVLAKELKNCVHFIRISMDGVNSTYESIRKRPFSDLLKQIKIIRQISAFGINFLVNKMTFPDLNKGIDLALKMGASEFLLVPEISTDTTAGIDSETMDLLQGWVLAYQGDIPLAVSEVGRDILPTCEAFPNEMGLHAYAHIDASSQLKQSSFEKNGVIIDKNGVMKALKSIQEDK